MKKHVARPQLVLAALAFAALASAPALAQKAVNDGGAAAGAVWRCCAVADARASRRR